MRLNDSDRGSGVFSQGKQGNGFIFPLQKSMSKGLAISFPIIAERLAPSTRNPAVSAKMISLDQKKFAKYVDGDQYTDDTEVRESRHPKAGEWEQY
mmetsp:Transcript_13187/g.26776  ORF Transcript_13187/g.26776 Transcript_13187/m.26776 type:complete len:96 (-) Transcript_13187:52-339(-)